MDEDVVEWDELNPPQMGEGESVMTQVVYRLYETNINVN
jgi:hypothetical protein